MNCCLQCNFCQSFNVKIEKEWDGRDPEPYLLYSCGDCKESLRTVVMCQKSLKEAIKDIEGFFALTGYDNHIIFGNSPDERYPQEWHGHKVIFVQTDAKKEDFDK